MAKPILIKRAQHDKNNPYFVCRREPAQDRDLSWEARGMLWYLLSKPDDWEVKPKDLEQQCAKGRVYRIIGELRKAHYIKRTAVRDDLGRITEWLYEVHELPYLAEIDPDDNVNDDPVPQNQEVENPEMGNADYTNYRGGQNTEKDFAPMAQVKTAKPEPGKQDYDWKGIVKAVNTAIGIYGKEQNHIANMLLGRSKAEPYCDYNLTDPATPDEIIHFGRWMKQKHPDISIRKPKTIESYYLQFRAQSQPKPPPQIEEVEPTITPLMAATRFMPTLEDAS